MWSSREDSEEKSPPAEAPAPGPAERKSTTNGDDARPAGLLHEPHELSTSTLTKLEAASSAKRRHLSAPRISTRLFFRATAE